MVGGAVLGGRQCVRVRPCALEARNSWDVPASSLLGRASHVVKRAVVGVVELA